MVFATQNLIFEDVNLTAMKESTNKMVQKVMHVDVSFSKIEILDANHVIMKFFM